MHTDGQPHGSDLFGYEGSCPRLLRVLYYLDELTEARAPFRLIPRSHLSFHADASPCAEYLVASIIRVIPVLPGFATRSSAMNVRLV